MHTKQFNTLNTSVSNTNLNNNNNQLNNKLNRLFIRVLKDPVTSENLITRNHFISMTGRSPAYFHAVLQKKIDFPKPIKRGRRDYYRVSEVNKFIEDNGL